MIEGGGARWGATHPAKRKAKSKMSECFAGRKIRGPRLSAEERGFQMDSGYSIRCPYRVANRK